jgi:predicted outer membrane protein
MAGLGFSESQVMFMNELRYYRNGIKYYGKRFDEEYAEKVMLYMDEVYELLDKKLK